MALTKEQIKKICFETRNDTQERLDKCFNDIKIFVLKMKKRRFTNNEIKQCIDYMTDEVLGKIEFK